MKHKYQYPTAGGVVKEGSGAITPSPQLTVLALEFYPD